MCARRRLLWSQWLSSNDFPRPLPVCCFGGKHLAYSEVEHEMGSNIEWTDETWNPVTGCSRVSPGCDNCYMYAIYPRLRGMGVPGYSRAPDVVTLMPERIDAPLHWSKHKRVFVNSMSDLFHRDVPFEFILQVFESMRTAGAERGHIFQVLTKRPGLAVAWWQAYKDRFPEGWPSNVWLGTSVESQKYAPRVTVLARVPAPVRFVSAEPLLTHVDLAPWIDRGDVHWVIVGGESGPRARDMDVEWVRSLQQQCERGGVPVFVKQMGSRWAKTHCASDSKGGTMSDWPDDIRVRLYPTSTRNGN